MNKSSNAVLYYKQTCPFCLKVLGFMAQKGIELELRSTTDESNRDELMAIGGKAQVPCLVIDGKPLYESNDIISYLVKEWDTEE